MSKLKLFRKDEVWYIFSLDKLEETDDLFLPKNIVASSNKIGEIPLINIKQVNKLLEQIQDEITLQDLIDRRNTPERYNSIRKRYDYSEKDIKDIFEEYFNEIKDKTEFNCELEEEHFIDVHAPGDFHIDDETVNYLYHEKFYHPKIHNGFINILKISVI